jgi:hypothetical protein
VGTSPAYGAAILPDGKLLVSEWNGTIWQVDAEGQQTPYVKLPANVYQIATDTMGTVYAATWDGNVLRWRPNSKMSTLLTGFEKGRLVSVAASPDGVVYAAERGVAGRILRFGQDGSRRVVFQAADAAFYGLSVDQEFLYALDLHDARLLRLPLDHVTRNVITNDR